MISEAFRQFKYRRRVRAALAEIDARPRNGRPHGLPAPLIVSLTSYSLRFDQLIHTLNAILRQSVRPDSVILWLDPDDVDLLPDNIRALTAEGLEIAVCPNWRSYKKIIPTLIHHPGSYIVTADDDAYYGPDWLAGLVEAAKTGLQVTCNRAHRIALGADGLPLPYERWDRNMDHPEQSRLVFLTGVMGVIYAPGVFDPEVTRHEIFTELCPSCDDVWLYWMHRRLGIDATKLGGRVRVLDWPDTQLRALRSENTTGLGNDRGVAAMIARYGFPD